MLSAARLEVGGGEEVVVVVVVREGGGGGGGVVVGAWEVVTGVGLDRVVRTTGGSKRVDVVSTLGATSATDAVVLTWTGICTFALIGATTEVTFS